MDYLDPKKERAQTIRLMLGYLLIGVAILIGTLILLYQAYGFGIDKDGEVIQSGLVFVSSQPDRSEIYLNGKLYKDETNAKLQLQEGKYSVELKRNGYNSWSRDIDVPGGMVQHFTYPKLYPTELKTTNIKAYAESPPLAMQSPDRRWIIVQPTASPLTFDVHDLSNFETVSEKIVQISLPESVVTGARSGTHALKLIEWSTNNRHVLLQHDYNNGSINGSEYIMLDRTRPDESRNLTRTLQLTPAQQLQLYDKKPDQFYVHDTQARTVGRTSIDAAGTVTPLLDSVLAYKPYGRNMVLYVTDKAAPTGQTLSMLYDNGQTYKIREHGTEGPFLIDMAEYNQSWYVVVGASGDDKVYIYKNPQRVRKASSTAVLVPVQIMRMDAPNKLQFSSNTQFVMLENGTNFANYDAETDKGYRYTSILPLDQPATAATWMDGQRITYVSGGKVVVFDYDNINGRSLAAASPNYLPFFDRDYDMVYTLSPVAAGGMVLTQTSLRTPDDL